MGGMVKWQADHTEDVASYTEGRKQRMEQKKMPLMKQEHISEVLFEVVSQHKSINYQLNRKNHQGIISPIKSGIVYGYLEDEAYIGDVAVNIHDISWCVLEMNV